MLAGKVALVTGSTSGIGLGIARCLASHGAELIVHGLEGPAAAKLVMDDLRANYGFRDLQHSSADLRDPTQVTEMMGLRERVDILVNNAGIQYVAPVEDFPLERWRAVVDVNLTACFLTAQAALPAMRANGWGRIINVASVHGRVASANKAAYVSAKHGVIGLTKTISLETVGTGITCNSLCPGWVLTPLVEAQIAERSERNRTSLSEETRKLLEEKQPSGEFATPDDIGELAAFLCTKAAAQITGEDIAMDGGWTAV